MQFTKPIQAYIMLGGTLDFLNEKHLTFNQGLYSLNTYQGNLGQINHKTRNVTGTCENNSGAFMNSIQNLISYRSSTIQHFYNSPPNKQNRVSTHFGMFLGGFREVGGVLVDDFWARVVYEGNV